MRTRITPLVLGIAIAAGCTKQGEPGPAGPTGPASAAPAAAGEYPMCRGQRLAIVVSEPRPRSGPTTYQLAPAFLEEMNACRPDSALPRDLIAKAGEGTVNAKGDCEYASIGVSCHYHTGSEFLSVSTTQQTAGRGELHCIFPSSDPKSPSVYGGHVMCRGAGQGKPNPAHQPSHEVKAGAKCPAALVAQLEACQTFRCCDDGTLTTPIAELIKEGRNDIRPDFRICTAPIELDCGLLENLTGHEANSPALGGVGAPAFTGGRKH